MIFFDLDGTLLDSNGLWLSIDETFLKNHGIETIPEDYITYVTNHIAPKAATFTKERFQLEESPEEILETWEDMAKYAYCNELPLTNGAKELLCALGEKKVPVSLLTACLPELCHGALKNHGISDYFHSIHIAIHLGYDKREKELFSLVAKLHHKNPSQCILIDDAVDYCKAAKEAGFTVIGIQDPSMSKSKEQLEAVCDYFVEDLTQVSVDMLCGILEKAMKTPSNV